MSDALREGVVGRVSTLDPLYVSTGPERDLAALLFRGLTRLGDDGAIVGDLAASWDVADGGRTYTFRLRPDARWQDGATITAADVAFTVRVLQDPTYNGPNGSHWLGVTVETPDPATVVFRLADPAAGFISLTRQGLVPVHLLGGLAISDLASGSFEIQPVASGAFRLLALTADEVRLERFTRNPATTTPAIDPLGPPPGSTSPIGDIVSGVAALPAITVRLFDDPQALADAFAAGELDAVGGLSPELTARLAALPGVRTVAYPRTTLTAAIPNVRPDHPLFRDVRVRRALFQALDRDALVRDALYGYGAAAESPFLAEMPPLQPPAPSESPAGATAEPSPSATPSAGPAPPFDPTAAVAGLKAAGWTRLADGWHRPKAKGPVGFDVVTVDAATNPAVNAIAQRLVASWQSLGLAVTLRALAAGDLVQGRLLRHDFQVAVIDINLGFDPDLLPLLSSTEARRGGTNLAGYQSAVLDKLLVASHGYAEPALRAARVLAVERAFVAQLPFLPLVFGERVELLRERVQGPRPRLLATPSDRFWDVLTWRLAGAP